MTSIQELDPYCRRCTCILKINFLGESYKKSEYYKHTDRWVQTYNTAAFVGGNEIIETWETLPMMETRSANM